MGYLGASPLLLLRLPLLGCRKVARGARGASTVALSSGSGLSIRHMACSCHRVRVGRFPCPGEAKGVKRQHALCELWVCESRRSEILSRVWQAAPESLPAVWGGQSFLGQVLWGLWRCPERWSEAGPSHEPHAPRHDQRKDGAAACESAHRQAVSPCCP